MNFLELNKKIIKKIELEYSGPKLDDKTIKELLILKYNNIY